MGIRLKANHYSWPKTITADDVELTDGAVRVWENVEIRGLLWDAYVDDFNWWYFLCVSPGESMFANAKKIGDALKSIDRWFDYKEQEEK